MHEVIFRRVVLHQAQQGFPNFGFTKRGRRARLAVDPFALFDSVEQHFTLYVQRLRDPTEIGLIRLFDRFWQIKKARG